MRSHSRITALTDAGILAEIDRCFALLLTHLGSSEDTALAAAVTSAVHRGGHTCLDLRNASRPIVELVEQPDTDLLAEASAPEVLEIALPRPDALLETLRGSPVVTAGESPDAERPLVLDRDRLYLHRLFDAECRLAERLVALATDSEPIPGIERAIARMFDEREDRTTEAVAALRTALERRLCIVTGGPGTGKTTLAAKLIAVLVAEGLADPRRIGLAAPTGKAASRIQESVRGKLAQPPLDDVLGIREFPAEAWTIHRLLASRTSRLSRLDALVVDECSMADLKLMDRLATSLPPRCRLILLGDANQLASVEPGSVFSDLCRAGEAGPLVRSVTTLRKNYRFAEHSAIGRLARAIVAGDAAGAAAVLRRGSDVETRMEPLADEDAFDRFAEKCAETWAEHMARLEADPEAADPFPSERVLCSHRRGPFGTRRFNRLVERRLARMGRRSRGDEFYVGRPIIVSRNDRQTNLSNGDTGVVVTGASGRPEVWFPDLDRDGERYLVPLARLPQHESFFALTVHRAQGSEYDDLVIIPGPAESRVNTRELFYTAVTRARNTVTVMAGEDAVRTAVLRTTSRSTGLLDRLR